ncbi:MAG: hypothetical protein HQ518_28185 [Rhodopirellula sp.]|nr:hypothetical protein [Rhodopirellula sp.]
MRHRKHANSLPSSGIFTRQLMVSSLILTLGWAGISDGGDTGHFTASGREAAVAVATANKSARVEPGYSPVRPVSYDLLAQNEAAAPSKPAPAPPAGPRPSTDPATKLPPAGPATAPPVSPPPRVPAAPQPLTPFSAMQLPPGQQPFLSRLSGTPDVFGDSFIPVSASFDVGGLTGNTVGGTVNTDLPLGGGMRRFKNEHARALPTDRVFFLYNHFHNALDLQSNGQTTTRSVDQFTLGFEKTFGDGQWSFELRMPFSGEANLAGGGVAVQSNGVGNLVGTLKRLLYSDSTFAAAFGLAVIAPTGSDASVSFPGSNTRLDFKNDATHLLPYLALQSAPDDNWFFHAFAQVDVAANQNEVRLVNNMSVESASLADQTLLYLDGSAGYWWYRATDGEGLTGLASVIELHYTTTLNNADSVNLSGTTIGNFENRYDVLNLTAGVHSEWSGNTAVRVAVVVPLDRTQRFFDSETQVSVIRRY